MGRKSIELVLGTRYGKWTVAGEKILKDYDCGDRKPYYPCICDCGTHKLVNAANLVAGKTTCCGCVRGTHGESRTRLYFVWYRMVQRCTKTYDPDYQYYGEKGIKVCDEWFDYVNFRDWALNPEKGNYQPGLTIDRKDNDGNYTPDNCHFVSARENCNNRGCTIYLEAFGEKKPLGLWVDDPRCVVTYASLTGRYQRGWDAEAAITTPLRSKPQN